VARPNQECVLRDKGKSSFRNLALLLLPVVKIRLYVFRDPPETGAPFRMRAASNSAFHRSPRQNPGRGQHQWFSQRSLREMSVSAGNHADTVAAGVLAGALLASEYHYRGQTPASACVNRHQQFHECALPRLVFSQQRVNGVRVSYGSETSSTALQEPKILLIPVCCLFRGDAVSFFSQCPLLARHRRVGSSRDHHRHGEQVWD